jgi:cofilin
LIPCSSILQASGIAVNEEVITTFQNLKLGKKTQYAIFRINDSFEEVIVEKVQNDQTASWDDFTSSLPKDDCRYAVYDFPFKVDGGQRNKLLFIVW